jgi:hypothetical protein
MVRDLVVTSTTVASFQLLEQHIAVGSRCKDATATQKKTSQRDEDLV